MYKKISDSIKKKLSRIEKRKSAEAGFTLLELLLSVGVTSLIVMGVYQIAEDSVLTTVNRNEATYYKKVHEAAVSYVKTNFDEIWVTGLGEVTDSTLPLVSNGDSYGIAVNNTGAPVPPMYLKDPVKGTLPAAFPDVSPSGRQVRIFARDIGFIGGDRALEVYTIMYVANGSSPRPLLGKSLHEITQILGPKSGVLTLDSPATAGIDESTSFASKFGAWDLPVNDFIANAVPASNVSFVGYEANFNIVGGYVALRDVVKFSDSLGLAYLYRIEVNDDPLFNTMETNLDMNGNLMNTIGTLTADHITANNLNLAVDTTGGNIVPTDAAGSFFVDEVFYVEGDAHVVAYAEDNGAGVGCVVSGLPGAARTASGTGCSYAGGNFLVKGSKATLANSPNATESHTYSLDVGNLVVQREDQGANSADENGGISAQTIDALNNITIGTNLPAGNGSGVETNPTRYGTFIVTTAGGTGSVVIDEAFSTGGIATNTLTTEEETESDYIQAQAIASGGYTGNMSIGRLNAGRLDTEARFDLSTGTGGLRVVQNMEAENVDITSSGLDVDEMFVSNETTNCRTNRYFGQIKDVNNPANDDFAFIGRSTNAGTTYDCSNNAGGGAQLQMENDPVGPTGTFPHDLGP